MKYLKNFVLFSFFIILTLACQSNQRPPIVQSAINSTKNISASFQNKDKIQTDGKTIETRFLTPNGYKRIKTQPNSFGEYLRSLPLKEAGAKVHHYNGQLKNLHHVYCAVVDMDVGKKDLQQCADAVMRLRSEYLFAQKKYKDIHFNFTNGFRVDYDRWRAGERIGINGNKTYWKNQKVAPSDSYESFRKYLELIFMYAGTLSLSKELKPVTFEDLQIGDVLIKGGSPGHAVIVVDVAEHVDTKEKIFLIAQSYMPAQEIHVLNNLKEGRLSPWYTAKCNEMLYTPEWGFQCGELKRFED